MKSRFALVASILMMSISVSGLAAAKGPEVDLIDNKLSVNVDSIPLSRLLQLVDRATGMTSKVPPELANRSMNVKFSGLELTDAVRKIFQGLPLDYVVVRGQGIIVTAASQTTSGSASEPVPQYNSPGVQPVDQPFVQDFPPPPGIPFQPGVPQPQQQQPPAMVQTPFGPIPNPNARVQQGQPNNPVTTPGQNTLFPQSPQPIGQPIQNTPGLQQGNPVPFGSPIPFGTPNVPVIQNQNNGLFGNVPGAQQR